MYIFESLSYRKLKETQVMQLFLESHEIFEKNQNVKDGYKNIDRTK